MRNAAVSTNAIDIIGGAHGDRDLEVRMRTALHKALRPLASAPVSARIRFVGDNSPTGCPGVRCMMTVAAPYEPTVRAEDVAPTSRLAFDGALGRLQRQIARYRTRSRDRRRRSKKELVGPSVGDVVPIGGRP